LVYATCMKKSKNYPVLGGKPCRFTVSILVASDASDGNGEWRRLAGLHTHDDALAYAKVCVERDGFRTMISDWETAQSEVLVP
jgi:hypothetical protein